MFFLPEPIRNETNRIAAEEKLQALESTDRFEGLATKDDDDNVKTEEVSNLSYTKFWIDKFLRLFPQPPFSVFNFIHECF